MNQSYQWTEFLLWEWWNSNLFQQYKHWQMIIFMPASNLRLHVLLVTIYLLPVNHLVSLEESFLLISNMFPHKHIKGSFILGSSPTMSMLLPKFLAWGNIILQLYRPYVQLERGRLLKDMRVTISSLGMKLGISCHTCHCCSS